MINLTSPCCGVTAKYADEFSTKYGCAGCGSGFTLEQAKAVVAAVPTQDPVPSMDAHVDPVAVAPAQPVVDATDAPADSATAAPSTDTPAAQ